MTEELSLDDFQKLVDSMDNPTFIMFSADFCQPCKKIKPRFKEEAKTNKSITFVLVDAMEAPEIASHCSVSKIPVIKVFVKGQIVDEMTGADIKQFESLVAKYSGTSISKS